MLAAVTLAACAGDERAPAEAQRETPDATESADFPRPAGRTLAELRQGLPEGPVLAPSVGLLEPGANRFGFGLFDRSNKQIARAPAAVYFARAGGGRAQGPFVARSESLEVTPAFQSQSAASDPDSARSVFVAKLPFKRPGAYELLGLVQIDGRLMAAESAQEQVRVVRESPVPDVGERPPPISTPTRESAGSIEAIDTRLPPDTMHDQNFAAVVGRRPVVLLFATPALCQSRVCGPVVDVTEQVKSEHEGDVEFIHMEIFNENKLENGPRPQVRAFGLPSEPWAFVVDARGRVAARLEGAFSARELKAAIGIAESA
jgi:hypothetical protein